MFKKQNPPKILFIILTSALLLAIALLLGPATVSADGPITYTYDEAGRLVEVDYGNDTSISYTYDAAGNLLSRETTTPEQCNALTSVGISGRTSGYTDTLYTFTGVITPSDATKPITYTWSPPPDSGQSTKSARYQWATPGVYTITLEAENCGGPVSKTHAITIEAPPPGCLHSLEDVGIKGPTSGYTGTLYAFTGIITPVNATKPVTYTWSPPPESGQSTESGRYQWATLGPHTITLTAENCIGPVSDMHNITINAGEQYRIYLPLILK